MVCSKCGNALPDGALFCNKCGGKAISETNAPAVNTSGATICSRCGNALPDGALFCNKCGGKAISETNAPAVNTSGTTICSKCGNALPDGALFCNKCGGKAISETNAPAVNTSGTTTCSKCGNALPDGALFCNKCGGSAMIGTSAQQIPQSYKGTAALPKKKSGKRKTAVIITAVACVSVIAVIAVIIGVSGKNTSGNITSDSEAANKTEPSVPYNEDESPESGTGSQNALLTERIDYSDDNLNISFSYPKDWVKYNFDWCAAYISSDDTEDPAVDICCSMIEDTFGALSGDNESIKAAMDKFSSDEMFYDYTFISAGDTMLGDPSSGTQYPGRVLKYECYSYDSGLSWICRDYYWAIGQHIYSISFSCDTDRSDEYEGLIKDIIGTVSITPYTAQNTDLPEEFTYSDINFKLSLKYPEGWVNDEMYYPMGNILFMFVNDPDSAGGHAAEIGICEYPAYDTMTSTVLSGDVAEIKAMVNKEAGYAFVSVDNITAGTSRHTVRVLEFEYTINGKTRVYQKCYWTIGNKVYVMTCFYNEDYADTYEKQIDDIIGALDIEEY